MKLKFFTFFLFLIVSSLCLKAQKVLVLQNLSTGKIVEVEKGTKVFYKLKSDSILGVEITEEHSILTMLSDTSFFNEDEGEVLFSDLSYLKIESKKVQLSKKILAPFAVAGIGIFGRGLYQGVFEGVEKNNKTLVPLQLGIGALLAGGAGYPFLIKPKCFLLDENNWEISAR